MRGHFALEMLIYMPPSTLSRQQNRFLVLTGKKKALGFGNNFSRYLSNKTTKIQNIWLICV